VWILSTASSEVVTLALLIPGVDIVDCSGIANESKWNRNRKMGRRGTMRWKERGGWSPMRGSEMILVYDGQCGLRIANDDATGLL
jgi:hypothetical protein